MPGRLYLPRFLSPWLWKRPRCANISSVQVKVLVVGFDCECLQPLICFFLSCLMQQKPRLVAPMYLINTSGQASYSKQWVQIYFLLFVHENT